MIADIPSLIHKLRNAPQRVGTFGRGDPDPLGQYRLVMTDEERDWLIKLVERAQAASEPKSEAILKAADDLHDLGFKGGWNAALEEFVEIAERAGCGNKECNDCFGNRMAAAARSLMHRDPRS